MAMPRPRRVCAESSNMEEPLRRGCDGASPWRSLPRWLNLWGDAAAEPRELLSAPLLEAVPPPPPRSHIPEGGLSVLVLGTPPAALCQIDPSKWLQLPAGGDGRGSGTGDRGQVSPSRVLALK